MLAADGGHPPHAHAVVRVHGRSEIVAAVYGDFVAQAGQFVASLLVIGFDAAVLGDQAATSDERDADAAARDRVLRCGGRRENPLFCFPSARPVWSASPFSYRCLDFFHPSPLLLAQ